MLVSSEGKPPIDRKRKIEGLPEEVPGRVVIVSDITYQAAKPLGRKDLVKVGPAVRDDSGRIIGCQGLAI